MIVREVRTGWVGFALVASLATAGALPAVTFNVTSILDEVDDSAVDGVCHTPIGSAAAGACTLRAAIMQADATSGAGATINLPAGTYTLARPIDGNTDLEGGDLNLTTPTSGSPLISIVGAGATKTIIDADQIDRVLRVSAGRTVTLFSLTLRNGFLPSGHAPDPDRLGRGFSNLGAGILNEGGLTLTDCVVSGSTGPFTNGGGIYSQSTLTLIRSTIAGNSAESGGGIFNTVTTTITQSTISGNLASINGAGIYNLSTFTATNSTISSNSADENGGGIYNNAGNVNFYNLTIAFNDADSDVSFSGIGAGLYTSGGSFAVRNTLLAGNYLSQSPTYDDCAGTVGFYGNDYYWEVPNCTLAGASVPQKLDDLALIGPLQNNGGPTKTHALLPGSDAINTADPTVGCIGPDSNPLQFDQRGVARVFGGRCDVGAYEAGPLFFDGFESGDLSIWTP